MLIKSILIPGLKTISADSTMVEAEKIMKESGFRHLPVFKDNKIIGILSDRDVHRATTVLLAINENSPKTHIQKNKKVSEYMSAPVFKMKSSEKIQKLIREMLNQKFSCTIIQDEHNNDIGIITTDDLMLLLLDKLDAEKRILKQLKKLFSRR